MTKEKQLKQTETEKLLAEAIGEIIKLVKSGKKLAKDEMPEVVREILLTARLQVLIDIGISISLAVVALLIFALVDAPDMSVHPNALSISQFLSYILGSCLVFAVSMSLPSELKKAVDVFFAPKLLILKELRALIK